MRTHLGGGGSSPPDSALALRRCGASQSGQHPACGNLQVTRALPRPTLLRESRPVGLHRKRNRHREPRLRAPWRSQTQRLQQLTQVVRDQVSSERQALSPKTGIAMPGMAPALHPVQPGPEELHRLAAPEVCLEQSPHKSRAGRTLLFLPPCQWLYSRPHSCSRSTFVIQTALAGLTKTRTARRTTQQRHPATTRTADGWDHGLPPPLKTQ